MQNFDCHCHFLIFQKVIISLLKIKGKHFGLAMGIGVDFDKICVFCGKYCIRIDKYVFIVVKIKWNHLDPATGVNFDKICVLCDK